MPRYALYFAPPPDSAWWHAGSSWLGRCAVTGQTMAQPSVPGVPVERFQRLTAAPAHYGWHATLKAPFHLAPGVDRAELERQLVALCARLDALTLAPLRVARLGHFLALLPSAEALAVQALAGECVRALHPLAAPLKPAELARRRSAGLSERQEALLQAWGYPYVFEQFRFHFSLTGSLDGEAPWLCEAIERTAQSWFEALPPCPLSALSLFEECAPAQPMRLVGQWPLSAPKETL